MIRVRKKVLNNPPSEFQKGCFVWSATLSGSSGESSDCRGCGKWYCGRFKFAKYLLATGLLKDSVQDSLDMIVSSDEKLSDAVLKRQLQNFKLLKISLCHEKT